MSRVPTPLERISALVLAEESRRNLLGHWLTVMGVGSCRTAIQSTPISALTPLSAQELVIIEAPPDDVDTQAIRLRTRGWRNIVVSASHLDPHTAAQALARGVRVLLWRRRGLHRGMGKTPNGRNSAVPHHDTHADYQRRTTAQDLVSHLSERERTVLEQVARGHSNREIGELLVLSPLTIKSHLSRIGRKLGTGDRARMVLIALRSGAIK